jgi:hypothetical protein
MLLHDWAFPLEFWRASHGMEGGEVNGSNEVVKESFENIGAAVMGRNMFGGGPGPWDASKLWNGWWGENPPYHHPVFVLTHHARESLALEGGNTFTFVSEGFRGRSCQGDQGGGRQGRFAGRWSQGGSAVSRRAGLVDEWRPISSRFCKVTHLKFVRR